MTRSRAPSRTAARAARRARHATSIASLCFVLLAACDSAEVAPDAGVEPRPCTPFDPMTGEIAPDPADPAEGVADGRFDPALAADPTTGRLWLLYSGVVGVPGGGGFRVSHRLAYSDDNGATFCDDGPIVDVQDLADADCPPGATPPCHLNHEVGALAYVPHAAPERRWKHLDFLVGAGPDNFWAYSSYVLREAATPTELRTATPRRLLAGAAYGAMPAISTWVDRFPEGAGAAETRVDTLDPALAACLVPTELGIEVVDGTVYMSVLCGAADPAEADIVLLRAGDADLHDLSYVATLLRPVDALHVDPMAIGLSASDLFTGPDGTSFLAVSPGRAADGNYSGCAIFPFTDISTGALSDTDEDGAADPTLVLTASTSPHFGMCTWDAAATATGIVYAEAKLASTPPLQLVASGQFP